MAQLTTVAGMVIEACPDGAYEVVDLRNLRDVAQRACDIARETREGIVLHYGKAKSLHVGAHDKVDDIHARLKQGECDAVRVRGDGEYLVVSRNLRDVANAVVNLVCSKGSCILLHRPNGEYIMKVCPRQSADVVYRELTHHMRGVPHAA